MIRARFHHVIWDWNGTLLDDLRHIVEVLNGMLSRRALPALSVDRFRAIMRFPVIGVYPELGFDLERESFDDLSREFLQSFCVPGERLALHEGVPELLSDLASCGAVHSLLSAHAHDDLLSLVAHFELNRHFMGIHGAPKSVGEGKTARVRELMQSMHFRPDQTVLVGDTVHEYEIAQELGTAVVLVSHGYQNEERLASCGVPVAHSIASLRSLLLE